MNLSILQRAVRRYGAERVYARLTPADRKLLPFLWGIWARSDQLAPTGKWRIWLIMGGRGSGKTRSGAEWVRGMVEENRAKRIALVAETSADARDVMVEEGPSAIMKISRPDFMPRYEPSKRRLTWPNGAVATTYSADEPNQLRGPQHDAAWADEIAVWKKQRETWDNLMFGLRLTGPRGDSPRVVATTTPKNNDLILELAEGRKDPDGNRIPRLDVRVTGASTYDNAANLDEGFFDEMRTRYEGTRVGRQELYAELLKDVEGALWSLANIDEHRARGDFEIECTRIVVGVDPPGSVNTEAGIVGAGIGVDGDIYVLGDWSCKGLPDKWAGRSVGLYNELEANRIVAEKNFGGDMVKYTIRTVDDTVPIRVVTASRGKAIRAEPVAALYEQGRVHHLGSFAKLEDELTTWVPGGKSPNRLDGLVWAISDLTQRRKPGRARARILGGNKAA